MHFATAALRVTSRSVAYWCSRAYNGSAIAATSFCALSARPPKMEPCCVRSLPSSSLSEQPRQAEEKFSRRKARTGGASSVGPDKAGVCDDEDKSSRIVWVDLEMSGLDLDTHTILEMACVVTDSDLNVVAEAPNLIIHHTDKCLEKSTDWCKDTFAKSGLWEGCRTSNVSLREAEAVMVDFLQEHIAVKSCPLAGNTVYVDRQYLKKHMPLFEELLHYRIIDVSTVKELSRRWFPHQHGNQPKKKIQHRALSDIHESIEELRWYRTNVFRTD